MSIGVPGISDAVQIGSGAFGVVYRARQDSFERTVAVKVLANVDLNDDSMERFAREVRAIGRLSGHPNIVGVHSHGQTAQGYPYLLMEFCDKGSYGEALRQGKRYSWQDATEVGVAVAGALHTAHTAGILHRDVKPDNILLDSYGTPKLADFGIARISAQASMTAPGSLTGSPAHIAPELIAGQEPSESADLYSLASAIHTMITGTAPFSRGEESSILPLLNRISHEPPPHLSSYGVPGEVADVIFNALAKQPQQRPGTLADLASQLQGARRRLGVSPGTFRVLNPTDAPPPEDPDDVTIARRSWPPPAAGTFPAGQTSPARQTAPATPHGFAGPTTGQPSFAPPTPPTPPAKRRAPALIAILAVVALLAAAGGVYFAVRGNDSGEISDPPPTDVTDTSGETSGGSSGGGDDGPRLTDDEAATALLLSAQQVNQLSGPSFVEDGQAPSINANAGFCNEQIGAGPDQFSQRGFSPRGSEPGNLPALDAGGAVFGTAADAEAYMTERNATASCGSWNDGTASLSVFEPPFTPNLVGCRCQDVVLHEVVLTDANGATVTQYAVLAQQDRYIAAGFFYILGGLDVNPDAVDFVAQLVDAVVLQVDQVNQQAEGGG